MNFIKYFVNETWQGSTIYRLLFQWELFKRKQLFAGDVLDIGSGGNPSYGKYIYLDTRNLVKTDYIRRQGVDKIVDFNQKFPFNNDSFDTVLICNALYIAEYPSYTLKEISRVLRCGGHIVIVSPFVANEMPEPHDYIRFTSEGLQKITKGLFREIEIVPIGERGSVATYSLQPAIFLWPLRVFGYIIGLVIDYIIPDNIVKKHPFPLGHLYVGRKEKDE